MTDWLESTVLSGSILIAIPVAMAAGLVSFASPCVLPLVPGYLSYASGVGVQDLGGRRSRVVLGSVLFVLGFSVVYVAGGALFGFAGLRLESHARLLEVIAGMLAMAFALVMLGAVPFLQRDLRVHAVPAVGLGIAPLLGVFFGLGWVPCVGPTLGFVLGLAGNEATAGRGALLTAAYCLGLGVPFVLAAAGFARFASASGWIRRHHLAISRIGALLMLAVGALLVSGLWDGLIGYLQSWTSGYEVPL